MTGRIALAMLTALAVGAGCAKTDDAATLAARLDARLPDLGVRATRVADLTTLHLDDNPTS